MTPAPALAMAPAAAVATLAATRSPVASAASPAACSAHGLPRQASPVVTHTSSAKTPCTSRSRPSGLICGQLDAIQNTRADPASSTLRKPMPWARIRRHWTGSPASV